jgi:uncharacterized protein (UPF0335 family)
MNIEERLSRYGVADENGELVIDKVREKKDIIDSGVRLLHEIETLKSAIKEILEDAKDRGYDKKSIKLIIDNVFKNEISEKIAELQQIELEISNLYG